MKSILNLTFKNNKNKKILHKNIFKFKMIQKFIKKNNLDLFKVLLIEFNKVVLVKSKRN